MDVSAEAADLVVKESIQATESAVKLAGAGLKNVAALLLALARQDYKVTGKTNANRLARDTSAPAMVLPLKKEDIVKFQKLAKEYGVLYFLAQKKGNESGYVNIVSNQNYAAQLNAVMEALHYPIPQKAQEETAPKKVNPRAPQERSSPERGTGSTPSPTMEAATEHEQKPSVKKRLEGLRAASEQTRTQEQSKGPKTRTK